MSSGFYGSNDSRLSSKAGAMEFAIVMNTTQDANGRAVVDYREAKRLFDFISRNVKLPEVGRDPMDNLSEGYVKLMEMLAKEVDKKSSKKEV